MEKSYLRAEVSCSKSSRSCLCLLWCSSFTLRLFSASSPRIRTDVTSSRPGISTTSKQEMQFYELQALWKLHVKMDRLSIPLSVTCAILSLPAATALCPLLSARVAAWYRQHKKCI